MPTYDYQCSKCYKITERFVSIQERDSLKNRTCDCGYEQKRLPAGGTGIIFKGTGFYETDYKRKRKP